jgi:hypothetical protein
MRKTKTDRMSLRKKFPHLIHPAIACYGLNVAKLARKKRILDALPSSLTIAPPNPGV